MGIPGGTTRQPSRERSTFRYESLDFWRGIACLAVIVFHASFFLIENPEQPLPASPLGRAICALLGRGHIGVTIFFVISGYCITAACVRHKGGAGRYFYRRFRRIYPPAWVWIGVSICTWFAITSLDETGFLLNTKGIGDPLSMGLLAWVGNLTLTETWLSHLGDREASLFLGHYWTLCYEEQFYAVCGLGILICKSPARFFQLMLGITLAVLSTVLLGEYWPRYQGMVGGFFFDGKWLLFAAGIAVFYRIHVATPLRARIIDIGLLATAIIYITATYALPTISIPGFFPSLLFALLLIGLWRIDLPFSTNRLTRPISWCGQMCYSLYLSHWPVTLIVSKLLYNAGVRGLGPTLTICIPVCLVVSLIVGRMFYVVVERRFLNTKPMSSGLASPTANPTSTVPAAELA